jgi:hypothetical protein
MEYLEIGLMLAGFIGTGVFFYYANGLKKMLVFLADAEGFIKAHEADFPVEFKGLYEDLMVFLKDSKECLADGKLSFFEMKMLYKDGMALFDEAKGIVAQFGK